MRSSHQYESAVSTGGDLLGHTSPLFREVGGVNADAALKIRIRNPGKNDFFLIIGKEGWAGIGGGKAAVGAGDRRTRRPYHYPFPTPPHERPYVSLRAGCLGPWPEPRIQTSRSRRWLIRLLAPSLPSGTAGREGPPPLLPAGPHRGRVANKVLGIAIHYPAPWRQGDKQNRPTQHDQWGPSAQQTCQKECSQFLQNTSSISEYY
jgi:hypothetical protein